MGAVALIGSLVAMLAVALWLAITTWGSEGDVAISGHGYAAMAIGIVFSLAVGVGLMALVFYSNRAGYDEPAKLERKDGAPEE